MPTTWSLTPRRGGPRDIGGRLSKSGQTNGLSVQGTTHSYSSRRLLLSLEGCTIILPDVSPDLCLSSGTDLPLAHEITAVELSDSVFGILHMVNGVLFGPGTMTHRSALELDEPKGTSESNVPELECLEVL